MKDLQQKVAVITGAGSGIGRALALNLANSGAKLALNDYNKERLEETEELVSKIGADVISYAFDVSEKEAMQGFADRVSGHFGQVDLVFNNAGVALGKTTGIDLKYEDFEWVMGVNFWGMVYGSKAFLPHLIKQKEASLVNVSSIFGIMGVPFNVAYCSSKFAIRGFSEAMRSELKLYHPNVTITSVHPGGIKTNIARDSKLPVGQEPSKDQEEEITRFEALFITTPEDAAKVIMKGVRKKKGRVIIGRDAKIPDLLVRLLPAKYTGYIIRQFKNQLGEESFKLD